MSESEFELYLSLLTRFLQLKPGQRSEIADELRDHLEARLEELSKTGMSRDEAIHAALGEFGDAAELAQHFAQIAQRRRRRFIMRCTVGTVAGLTAAILLATAFWPGDQAGPMRQPAIAQDAKEASVISTSTAPGLLIDAIEAESNKLVEHKLDGQVGHLKFEDTPLKEALKTISKTLEIDVFLDEKDLQKNEIDPDALTVTLSLQYTKMSTAKQLQLMLKPLELGYRIDDGMLVVESATTVASHPEVRIYNCRDLLNRFRGKLQSPSRRNSKESAPESTSSVSDPDRTAAQGLIEVLCTVSNGPWEIIEGEGGAILEYNGLLVATNTQESLRSLERAMEVLRHIDKQNPSEALSAAAALANGQTQDQ